MKQGKPPAPTVEVSYAKRAYEAANPSSPVSPAHVVTAIKNAVTSPGGHTALFVSIALALVVTTVAVVTLV